MVKKVAMEDTVVTVDHLLVGEEEVLEHIGVLIHMVDPNLGVAAQKKLCKETLEKSGSLWN